MRVLSWGIMELQHLQGVAYPLTFQLLAKTSDLGKPLALYHSCTSGRSQLLLLLDWAVYYPSRFPPNLLVGHALSPQGLQADEPLVLDLVGVDILGEHLDGLYHLTHGPG